MLTSPSAPMGAHILLVEDEEHLARGIELNLTAEGHKVTHVPDGAAAQSSILEDGYDLVVLDVMLPKKDGFAVCQAVRQAGSTVPILFLSARASAEERVHGLKLGADDYLGKPFHLAEFLGRIEALLRRSPRRLAAAEVLSWPPTGATIDFGRAEVRFASGLVTSLSTREAAVLRRLLAQPDHVVSREELLEAAWGHEVMPSSRVLDELVGAWRERLEPAPQAPVWLETIRGIGYRLKRPPAA